MEFSFQNSLLLLLVHLFQPFKFAYCLRLIDAGLIETAFRYLEVLSDSISTLLEQEVEESCTSPIDLRALFLIASQCLRLSERLRHHPEVGSFEMEGDSHSNVFRGGFTSPRPRWMERLRSVYERISSVVSFYLPHHLCHLDIVLFV